MPEQPTSKGNGGGGGTPSKVVFHYIKNQHFRVIHVDGAIGALTPNGHIHFSLYSERPAIPQRMTHEVKTDGTLGSIIPSETISREGIVRELDIDAIMNLATARSFHDWLGKRIEELASAVKPPESK